MTNNLDLKLLQTVINHPTHILSENNGGVSPTAFIPFCSFGGAQKLVGTELKGFDIPVCSIFEPAIRNEQLCYEADLEKFRERNNDEKLKKQLEIGLVLLLDYNEERQIDLTEIESFNKSEEKIFDYHQGNPASVYLDTLSKES